MRAEADCAVTTRGGGAGSASGCFGSIARTSTRPGPFGHTPIFTAAAYERSMRRLSWNGPRSLMRTTTLLPLSRLVPRAYVGSGSVLCAALNAYMSYGSSEEVM